MGSVGCTSFLLLLCFYMLYVTIKMHCYLIGVAHTSLLSTFHTWQRTSFWDKRTSSWVLREERPRVGPRTGESLGWKEGPWVPHRGTAVRCGAPKDRLLSHLPLSLSLACSQPWCCRSQWWGQRCLFQELGNILSALFRVLGRSDAF